MPRLLKLNERPPTRPAHTLPMLGVWVERGGETARLWQTGNRPDAMDPARAYALACIRSGATSASIRMFAQGGMEHMCEILDWRDLPENATTVEEFYH